MKVGSKERLNRVLSSLKISKSSYYRLLNHPKEDRDYKDYLLIKKIFEKRKQRVGVRQLKMLIEREYGLAMNKKKIARIKRKYGLVTKIRKKNSYRLFAKKNHEHKSAPNKLDRKFEVKIPDTVYSTDITQLSYGSGKRAYLAAFKDLCTKEIRSQTVSHRIDLALSNSAADKALVQLSSKQKEKLMIHSDQGLHYTHLSYRKKLEDHKIEQSMSRRGNCLDNAPIESFFGLIKDHLDLKRCQTIEDVKKAVTKEINYYNNQRPQLGLKKMPPVEYRKHLEEARFF